MQNAIGHPARSTLISFSGSKELWLVATVARFDLVATTTPSAGGCWGLSIDEPVHLVCECGPSCVSVVVVLRVKWLFATVKNKERKTNLFIFFSRAKPRVNCFLNMDVNCYLMLLMWHELTDFILFNNSNKLNDCAINKPRRATKHRASRRSRARAHTNHFIPLCDVCIYARVIGPIALDNVIQLSIIIKDYFFFLLSYSKLKKRSWMEEMRGIRTERIAEHFNPIESYWKEPLCRFETKSFNWGDTSKRKRSKKNGFVARLSVPRRLEGLSTSCVRQSSSRVNNRSDAGECFA